MTLNLPAGDYYYCVGISKRSMTGYFSIPTDSKLDIVFEFIYKVQFTVTDTDGSPIEDAWIWVDSGYHCDASYTNSSGYSVLDLPVGDYDFEVRADGFTTYGNFSVPEVLELTIALESLGEFYRVEFTVTDTDGAPIGNACIIAARGDYSFYGYTESSGKLTLNLPAGDYDYQVGADGFFSKYGEFSVPTDSEVITDLKPYGQLYEVTFTVTDENVDQIEDAWISAHGGDCFFYGWTDSSGNLTLNLPAGDYDLYVEANGYAFYEGTFSVPADLEHNIVLTKQATKDYSAVWQELYRSELPHVIPSYANQYYDIFRPHGGLSFNPIPRFHRNNVRYFQAVPSRCGSRTES